MTDRRDDDFRVRPRAPKNRGKGQGQSFVSKVLKQAGKASGGKSSMRHSAAGGGARAGQRPGSRLGRGHTAARFAGAKLTPMSRRVTIKTLLVNHQRASPQSLAKHLRYIERDGAGRDGEPGRAYGPQTDEADLDAFKERAADDRHHFRFIVSPEDGAELDDLRTYTRHLVDRMEADLGTRLDWVAVDHWNTDNPHTHLIVRGRDDTGKDLIIAGDYIAFARRTSFDVLVYKREGGVWGSNPVATIPRPAAGSSQYARCSNCVKFDGDRLIVGDIYLNGQRGGAFVFQRQAGSESFSLAQTITPAGSANDLHGFTLETEHERLYVGSATARSVGIYEFDQGQYVLRDTLTDTIDSGLGRGLSADGSRLLVGRGRAARVEGVSADRGRLYVSEGGVFDVCDVTPDCVVGTPFDWDGDGEDDGCRGTVVYIDASVTIPAGTQVGDDVQVLAGAAMGSGNILRDGSLLGVRARIGDDNDLGPGSIIGRRSMVGSRNALLAETVTSRAVVIGDDNRIGGSIGYAAELGNNLDLPNATIGSLVIIGAPGTPAGQIDCPGPLVVARSAVIADDPANGFTCTGSVVIGPESVVEGAAMQDTVRLRKQTFLGATVTVGSGVRIGRDAVIEGGVALATQATVPANVRVCDTDNPVSGRLDRGYVDPTCP